MLAMVGNCFKLHFYLRLESAYHSKWLRNHPDGPNKLQFTKVQIDTVTEILKASVVITTLEAPFVTLNSDMLLHVFKLRLIVMVPVPWELVLITFLQSTAIPPER